MHSISHSRFKQILSQLKPVDKLEKNVSDLPESETNSSSAHDGIDAHPYQGGLTENLTEGHITGSGGPVVKNATTSKLTDAQKELRSYKARDKNYYPGLGMLNDPRISTPVEMIFSGNKAILSNPFTAALGYGLGGYGIASGFIGAKNWLSGREPTKRDKERQRKQKLLAALGAGAAGLGLRKWASLGYPVAGDPLTFIAMKLQNDTTMTPIQQQQMLEAIANMSRTQQSGLAQILTTVAGAGIGAAVAKFLMNMGIGGTIGGALLGGFFGARAGRFPENNPGTINNTVDFFGRPI